MCVKALPPNPLFFSLLLPNWPMLEWCTSLCGSLIRAAVSLLLVAHKVYISSFLHVARKKKINVNFVLLLTFVLWLQFFSQAFFPDIHHHSLLYTGCKTTPAAVAALIPLFLFNSLDQPGLAFLPFLKTWFSCAARLQCVCCHALWVTLFSPYQCLQKEFSGTIACAG